MKSVRLFDFIRFDGDTWQVVKVALREGPMLTLRSLTSHRRRKVLLATLLEADSFSPDSPDRLPRLEDIAIIERRAPEEQKSIEFIHRHVYEVLNGYAPDEEGSGVEGQAVRGEYDPSLPLRDRVDAKCIELEAAGTPMSASTLKRHISSYRKDGVAGLIDHRRSRPSTPAGRVHPEVVRLVKATMAEQENYSTRTGPVKSHRKRTHSTGTRSRVIAIVTLEAEAQRLPVPSRSTFYRLIKNVENGRHPFGNATTRRSLASRPDRTFGHQDPVRPGELVEVDTTPLDVFALYPDGTYGKADLAGAYDVTTGTFCSAILRPVATKAVDAAVLLARMHTPLPMQPGWDKALSLSRSILPHDMLMNDAELREHIAARPIIIPENVTIDRGKIFVGRTFLSACERLEITVVKAAPRTGSDKPHIERAFRTLNTGFTQFLAGYKGSNVLQRGDLPEGAVLLPIAQLQDLLDQFLVAYWQNRPLRGLRHPAMPGKDLSPNEMYTALSAVAPSRVIAFNRDDYIALIQVDWRSIQAYGINFRSLIYDSPALHPYRKTKSGLKAEPARNRYEIRYDPYRLNAIFVRDHHKGEWIEAEWTMARQVLGPFSLEVLNAALKAVDKRQGRPPGCEHLGRNQPHPVRRHLHKSGAKSGETKRCLTTRRSTRGNPAHTGRRPGLAQARQGASTPPGSAPHRRGRGMKVTDHLMEGHRSTALFPNPKTSTRLKAEPKTNWCQIRSDLRRQIHFQTVLAQESA